MPSIFIALEKDIRDFDPYVNGQALCDADRKLERIAKKLSVTHLMDFFSQNPEEAVAFIEDEGGDPEEVDIPDETWFDADEGLTTVNALLEYLATNPNAIPNSGEICAELKEWQTVLGRAKEKGIRWHLEVDY